MVAKRKAATSRKPRNSLPLMAQCVSKMAREGIEREPTCLPTPAGYDGNGR